MPKKPATPRTTRNSRGLRETTPTTGRQSRESSVSSDDGNRSAPTPLRRSRRHSRESSVASDDGNQPSLPPVRRSRRSRSRSAESTTNTTAATTSSQTSSTVAQSHTQLPLPPVPASVPVTPRATGILQRTFPGVAAAPNLTPIVEESPFTPAPIPTPFVRNSFLGSSPEFSSIVLEETVFQTAVTEAPVVEESPITPAPVSTPFVRHSLPDSSPEFSSINFEETVFQPAVVETSVAEESVPTLPRSATGLVEQTTTPRSLHQVGISFSLQPVTPLHYLIQTADDELQASIVCDESEKEGPFDESKDEDPFVAAQRQRNKARRRAKLAFRRAQLRIEWKLPHDCSEISHPVVTGEEPEETTSKYISLKKEEGHAFGARLLKAIKDDHERRGCGCPLPQVYKDRAAAEAGEGTFRFFRHFKQPGFEDVWVFMRKGDWHWHCTCDKKPLSDFALWVRRKHKADEQKAEEEAAKRKTEEQKAEEETAKRLARKRKAQDSEVELTDGITIRVVDGPLRRRILLISAKATTTTIRAGSIAARLRATSARLLRSARSAGSNLSNSLEPVKSMCGIYGTGAITGAITMGTSVKHFLSRVGAQLSTVWNFRQTQTAIENRTQDQTGNLVVKRFKPQHYVPITTTEEREEWEAADPRVQPSPFDGYAFFEWTDSPARYIGAGYLNYFSKTGKMISEDLNAGRYHWDVSEEAIRKAHKDGLARLGLAEIPGGTWDDEEFNLELSLRMHRHTLEKHDVKTWDALTRYQKESTRKWWEHASGYVSRMIDDVYGDKEIMSKLKEKFGPKPPKHLRDYWNPNQRAAARDARNFLIRLLFSEDEADDDMKLAITKLVADMDAIYKQDIPVSFVEFPGKYDKIMPGEWPSEILEEMPIEEVHIQPIIELQAPFREAQGHQDASPVANASPLADKSSADSPATPMQVLPARSILKPESISFDFTPEAPRPTIRFSRDILSFRSPRHKPPRISTPKPVKASRVEKKARPSKRTQELWSMFMNDIHNGRVKQRYGVQKVPLGRPEDQTMAEACDGRSRVDTITGETKLDEVWTKYDEFLDHTRLELFKEGFVIRPTTDDTQPAYDGSMTPGFPRSREDHDDSMVNEVTAARLRRQAAEQESRRQTQFARLPPKPVSPKPAKTVEDVKRERDLLLHDLEVNMDGELVRPSIILPDSELPIAIKKLDDLHIDRQLQEEAQAGAERLRIELARQAEEEKRRREAEERRKAEEERRRREEEERREAEERRRLQEVAAAISREEERVREAARRRAALGLRRPARAIITPLSAPWRARVAGIQYSAEGVELAKTPEGQPLTRRDFVEKLLPPTAWLNDNVIIGSIQHIGDLVNDKAGATKENPRCATFTSYFWPRLETVGPGSCGRMMRRAGVSKDNFKAIETILIPICSGNHWTLAVVLPQKGAVLHMDSLRGGRGNPSVTSKILEWVETTLAEDFVASEWSVINIDGPAQTNGWDCGVFTITNGLCMALGLDPKESYAAGQLRTARAMLAAILLNGGFKGDFALVGV